MAKYPFSAPCSRVGCGHSSDVHSLDDAQNVSPTDPAALFRCQDCDCPDMVRSQQNLRDLELESQR